MKNIILTDKQIERRCRDFFRRHTNFTVKKIAGDPEALYAIIENGAECDAENCKIFTLSRLVDQMELARERLADGKAVF